MEEELDLRLGLTRSNLISTIRRLLTNAGHEAVAAYSSHS